MKPIQKTLLALGMTPDTVQEIRQKDGVAVYRVFSGDQRYILKTFANEADRREIQNYGILHTLGLQTLQIIGATSDALLMEDMERHPALRLGEKRDMDDPAVAAALAHWYRELHRRGKAYIAAHGQGMYDETDAITPETMEAAAAKTDTAKNSVWALLRGHFAQLAQKSAAMERTLTYNDFYYTNLIVAKDGSAAFMFDYNLLGKGYAYADLRNVASSLGREAGQAFLNAYGPFDPLEEAFDAVASVLTTLHFGCQRDVFPAWAAEELEKVRDGRLEQSLRLLLFGALQP